MKKVFLLRYDVERGSQDEMEGFLEKVLEVHRSHEIPATFFCTGNAVERLEEHFRMFAREVKGNPLFDIQDHSYSHVGLSYRDGKDVEILRADYEKSFAAHERVFGKRPTGISVCGTSGAGPGLEGFEQTEKSREEFRMVADLGVRMINTILMNVDDWEFSNYSSLGYPDIMGFPSEYSDTDWLYRKDCAEGLDFVFSRIRFHAVNEEPMPLVLHDHVAWNSAPDKELAHVKKIVDYAREHGYELLTHSACYDIPALWK